MTTKPSGYCRNLSQSHGSIHACAMDPTFSQRASTAYSLPPSGDDYVSTSFLAPSRRPLCCSPARSRAPSTWAVDVSASSTTWGTLWLSSPGPWGRPASVRTLPHARSPHGSAGHGVGPHPLTLCPLSSQLVLLWRVRHCPPWRQTTLTSMSPRQ